MNKVDSPHSHPQARQRALMIAVAATVVLMVVKGLLGIAGQSLALLTDAGHTLGDVLFLAAAWFAARLSQRGASGGLTWGYPRAGVLVGLLSAIGLIVIAVAMVWASWQDFFHPHRPDALAMLVGGGLGIAVNVILSVTLTHHHDDLNVRSAWIHVISDALASLAVVVAGVLIAVYDWLWTDPLGAFIIGVVIVYSAIGIIRDAWAVLMEAAPKDLNLDNIRTAIAETQGVQAVHHLHVWSLTPGQPALSAHVQLSVDCSLQDGQNVIRTVSDVLNRRFHITHSTLQIELDPNCEAPQHESR